MLIANTLLVVSQVATLFLLIAIGFAARKFRLIQETGIRQLINVLMYIITPCLIIDAFQTPFDKTLISGLLVVMLVSLAAHVLAALFARLLFRRVPLVQAKVLRFAIIFSNCGFFTIPLAYAIIGPRGVFYGSVYIAVFNIVTWTYGVFLMSGNAGDINLKRALINPGIIGLAIALPLYVFEITLPGIPAQVIRSVAITNTPIAMFIIGGQMAATPLAMIFTNRHVYVSSLFRLLAVPGIVMLLLHLFPFDRVLILACVLPAAAPSAAITAQFSAIYDQDTTTAINAIALSTFFSIITIPLLIFVSDLIGGVA